MEKFKDASFCAFASQFISVAYVFHQTKMGVRSILIESLYFIIIIYCIVVRETTIRRNCDKKDKAKWKGDKSNEHI